MSLDFLKKLIYIVSYILNNSYISYILPRVYEAIMFNVNFKASFFFILYFISLE